MRIYMKTEFSSYSSDLSIDLEFKVLAENLCGLASMQEKKIVPYLDPSLPHFSKLSINDKLKATESLKTYLEICNGTIDELGSLTSLKLVWFALKRLGLTPPSNLFSMLDESHVIEIHDLQGVQIFRNFNFYDFCSYTVEDLYCYPWSSLFEHEQSGFIQICEFVKKIATGQISKAVKLNMPQHFAKESFSVCKNEVTSVFEIGAPVFNDSGVPVATLVAERMQLIGTVKNNSKRAASSPVLHLI